MCLYHEAFFFFFNVCLVQLNTWRFLCLIMFPLCVVAELVQDVQNHEMMNVMASSCHGLNFFFFQFICPFR